MKQKGTAIDYHGRKGIVVGYDKKEFCNEVLFLDTLTFEIIHPSHLTEIPKEELLIKPAIVSATNIKLI